MPPELVAYLTWAALMAALTVAGIRWPHACGSLSWNERPLWRCPNCLDLECHGCDDPAETRNR